MGSKLDDETNRKVSYNDAWALCENLNGLAYYETSARNGVNIDEVFYAVASAAYQESMSVIPINF